MSRRVLGLSLGAGACMLAVVMMALASLDTFQQFDELPTLIVMPTTIPTQIAEAVNITNDDIESVESEGSSLVRSEGTSDIIVDTEPSMIAMSELTVQTEPVVGEVVIQFVPSTSEGERLAYIESIGGEILQSINVLDTLVVRVDSINTIGRSTNANIIIKNEPNYYVTALNNFPPDDPFYGQQWALPAIGVPQLWKDLSSDTTDDVIVAIIDSGICQDHPELENRIVSGYDYVEDDNLPQDDLGHGCGVAGIIASNTNNSIGIAGIAPNSKIMPLKVLNAQGIGTYSDVAEAIIYATDNGAHIINLSLGGVYQSALLQNAIDYAISNDVIVVAAAGNTGGDVLYPAKYPPVIAVGSVDDDLTRSSFSSYGPEIDALAPGRNIVTLGPGLDYSFMTGTSFAAPHVTGLFALEQLTGQKLILTGGLVSFSQSYVNSEITPESVTEPLAPAEDDNNLLFAAIEGLSLSQANITSPPATLTERERYVSINFDVIDIPRLLSASAQNTIPPQQITLNLFDDIEYNVSLELVNIKASGIIQWHGKIEGLEYGEVDLVINNNIIVGSVFLIDGTYHIRYSGIDDVHVIRKINSRRVDGNHRHRNDSLDHHHDHDHDHDSENGESAVLDNQDVQSTADDGSVIDIMVVYTDDARVAAGGVAAMQAEVELAEFDVNLSFLNSGINTQVNIVHSYEVNYNETRISDVDLDCITYENDNCLDGIHAVRDAYNADVVVMIGSWYDDACGVAWFQDFIHVSFEAWAFAVVDQWCSVNAHTFAHELGHIMGADHDLYALDYVFDGAFPYNHGYVNVAGQWLTTMAYDDECYDQGVICYQLRYWSTPWLAVDGVPIGDQATADNVRVLNNTAYTVANFRDGIAAPELLTPFPDGLVTNDDTPEFSWSDVDEADEFQLQVDDSSSFSSPEIDTTGDILSYTPASALTDAQYFWRVRAIGSDGTFGSWSPLWIVTIDTIPPGVPILISPISGAPPFTDTTPTFSWQSISDAIGYEIQLDNETPPVVTVQDSPDTSYQPTVDLIVGDYYWRVRAVDEANNISDWSQIQIVSVISPNNASPYLNLLETDTPTLSWNRSTGATEYIVEVSISKNFSDVPKFIATVPSNTLYIVTTSLDNGQYYWRVRAKNGTDLGAWSTTESFVVNVP